MKRPPTDIIDLTGEDEEDDIQVLGETAKPLKRSNGSKSSSRAASKSRDDGEESKSRTKKKRKVNGDEADGGETGRSRARSRASRRAPNSSKRRATPSQPTEGTNTSASDSNRIGGPAIIVGADNGDFFVDLEGDERLQPNVVALTVPTSEAVEPKIPSEANEGSKPSDEPHHTVNGWEVLSTPGKRSKSKTPKPLPAVVSETSNSGAVTPTVLPDIAEEADDEETEATTGSKERDKGHSKNAVKKAGRKERDKLAAPSTKGQPQAYGTATPADENSPLFFEDVEGITIAEHLQPDPIEEPLPALVNVDGLILPRHVKLTKEDAKHQGEGGADGGGSDESGSEDTEDDIESDDEDDDRPKGRRYWLTDEQLAAIPPCGICGEQGHDFRDCMHLKCTQCGALDDHESNRCPLFVTCWKCGEKGHVSVERTVIHYAPSKEYHCSKEAKATLAHLAGVVSAENQATSAMTATT
ncbi:hypothetical protein FRB90_007790 [Tulasnella sp. 427]|nr:hypothetical protein FRB90_007790 [Tulasnella sp. 427]